MSRVFVSAAYRDRDAGRRVGELLRAAGHEPVDDTDDVRGSAWWNEVIRRIDSCEAFVAVVSPAYAEAHTCRLAAKRAVAAELPVVRLELDGARRFDPDDRRSGSVLARAVDQALGSEPPAPAPAPPAPPPATSRVDPPTVEPSGPGRSWTRIDLLVGAVLLAAAAGLVLVAVLAKGADQAASPPPAAPSPSATASAAPAAAATTPAADVLAAIAAAASARLPAASCTAGAETVTCRDPAPSMGTVVLTPYPTTQALYDAYADQVAALAGGSAPENVGDCSGTSTEGELSWDLDLGHGDAVTVAEQEAGGLDPVDEAAGRLFCTGNQDVLRLVWTQDPGLLVTATGQPATLTIGWWHDVHLALACPALGGDGAGCA
ncbi:toll/interleukin-1 receptor domain-containing protein [Nocardioides anomalus]|uniref:Toll/interleukin-1 receptor domain-containing protein n=1 Tax=Nocardioides anomalus TaxID=2712223 RepID=A0A6G6WK76_9ACTN|nr:toll/interleukin-1 receptor domain-containing protein [Nocardioides anomalus]QIG45612.1 toll/interleukin-1 receptor domain-containing protein [Nocardioides anomalus]